MFNLQGSEIIVILLLALVVLGPDKLPDAIRRFTQTYNEIKKMGSGFQSELKSALDEPMREMRETADMVRDAADPDKIATAATERTAAAPAQGDPPLDDEAEPVPEAGSEAETTERVNQVAAANSSGAIAASRGVGDTADDHAADDRAADTAGEADGGGDESADEPAASVVAGPAFHSAAPRTVATEVAEDLPEPVANEVIDGANGADGGDSATDVASGHHPVESSDEPASA